MREKPETGEKARLYLPRGEVDVSTTTSHYFLRASVPHDVRRAVSSSFALVKGGHKNVHHRLVCVSLAWLILLGSHGGLHKVAVDLVPNEKGTSTRSWTNEALGHASNSDR